MPIYLKYYTYECKIHIIYLYSLLYFPVAKTTVLLSDINNATFVNEVYQECNYDHIFIIYNLKQHLTYKVYG